MLLALAACGSVAEAALKDECRPFYRTYFRLSLNERISEFGKRDAQAQYLLFVCGTRTVHPPAIYLAEPFARGGAAVVPVLKSKLSQAGDDLTIQNIVLVLSEMKRLSSYDVASDRELVVLAKNKVRQIRDPQRRGVAQRQIDLIVSPVGGE
ncbi:hypothetical protein [Lysobacter sp. TAB13]|uniref:hypothetical protein n=1 Tax=Lysobacter sp. TAB13 TaxID=3233065 RepID=UPI003F99DC98